MAGVRYAIAGSPVNWSLSPLLAALVHDHLTYGEGAPLPNFTLNKLDLVDTSAIEDALAWGYAGAVPQSLEWSWVNSPLDKFRGKALLEKAVEAAREVLDGDERLSSKGEETLELGESQIHEKLPRGFLREEVWINLTTPLKHTLVSNAVTAVDESMEIQSVNCLRWDGQGWISATMDGEGIVKVGEHHGLVVSESILALKGGGGAARSCAESWARHGGKILAIEGRRDLGNGPWSDSLVDSGDAALYIDFDGDDEEESHPCLTSKTIQLDPSYSKIDGSIDERIEALSTGVLDGRWMLASQHLECWRQVWAGQIGVYLPSLDLLLTRLAHAEAVFEKYS